MFGSIWEDREFLQQVFTPAGDMEPLDVALQTNTYTVQMFCLITELIQRSCSRDQYLISGYRAHRTSEGLNPESMEIQFSRQGGRYPLNRVWFRDGLLSWYRDRPGDRPLIGVENIQKFIRSLHV